MAKYQISRDSRNRLTRSLATYRDELAEIINAIGEQAKFVGSPVDQHIPKDLSDERQLIQGSILIVKAFREGHNELFGVEIPEANFRVMTSSLLLLKDDVTNRLSIVASDPLMPSEATFPLQQELEGLESNLEFFSTYGNTELLTEVRSRRERKSGLAYPRDLDLSQLIPDGEGQTIEFKEKFPEQTTDLAKEIAAFGTSNPGVILLGVANNSSIVGLDDIGSPEEFDKLKARVEGVSSNGISPSLPVRVRAIQIEGKDIAVIEVPKGPDPVYYARKGVPYIRHGSLSRPALPPEVIELVKRHLGHS